MNWYRAYGLVIASDRKIDGFGPCEEAPADVTIRSGPEARAQLASIKPSDMTLHPAPDGGWIFNVPDLCTFWMRDGRQIFVSPVPDAKPAHVTLYLLGSAMGMILHQRGLHALHAATVAIGGEAIAFVGEQGAGKSTLAALMAKAGHAVLGDDTIALSTGQQVWPGATTFKLWGDVLPLVDLPRGPRVSNRMEKFFVQNSHAATQPHALSAVVSIAYGTTLSVERVAPLAAIDMIAHHSYRPEYVPLLGRQADHFAQCAALAGAIPVWRMTRPRDLRQAPTCVAYLAKIWPMLTGDEPPFPTP